MNTIVLRDIEGNDVEASVGDYILEYDRITKIIRNTRIEGLKNGLKTGSKMLSKPQYCRFVKRGKLKGRTK